MDANLVIKVNMRYHNRGNRLTLYDRARGFESAWVRRRRILSFGVWRWIAYSVPWID